MTDLSPEARSLLRAARDYDEPGEDDFRRVRLSVLARITAGLGAAVGLSTSASYAAGASALFGTAAVKVGAAVLVVAGLAGTYAAVRPHVSSVSHAQAHVASVPAAPALATATATATATSEPKTVDRVASDESVIAALPTRAPTKARPAVAPIRRRATADLDGEARLLEAADAELRAGNAQAALRPLAEHAARYPNGALSDEREGVRAIALCRSGRSAEGTAAAERFLSGTRKTSLASRVRTACNIDKPSN